MECCGQGKDITPPLNSRNPSMISGMIAGGLALHAIPKTARVHRQFACPTLCVGQLIVYMKPNFSMYHGDKAKALLAASAWLEQQDYHSGYATFWNSDVVTEYTSGSIEMWTLSESSYGDMVKELILFDWLQEKSRMRRRSIVSLKSPFRSLHAPLDKTDKAC